MVASYVENGDTFLALGSLERAIETFNNAIELDPTQVDAYMGRGLRLLRTVRIMRQRAPILQRLLSLIHSISMPTTIVD